ncbi:MAG: phosphoenolpyruvate carboxykinase (GTP) [Candidatus Omnitrophica bacterium]|jgi:phosphoenolpyruvate carboxykinase (GTP)|nr:phosphoenolpyruvate carboxykinase (GTP) [Candidatus Omnitrophota bacterium]
MAKDYINFLKDKLDKDNFKKLAALENSFLVDFIGKYAEICQPRSIFIRTDSSEDAEYIRKKSLLLGEEIELATKGHTAHFDGYTDQGRDKNITKYLVTSSSEDRYYLNSIDREEGLKEIRNNLQGIMADKEMLICFLCLGPVNSPFTILAVQITDSCYVAHSEDILYRPGYEQFRRAKVKDDFFKFVHSAGVLENKVSKNIEQRRVYIDLENNLVYSVNTQYAGNTVGLKKLALRLAIKKAYSQDWLAEHMFLMGISGKGNKKSYFCGAYPSMCGKTSTAMLSGETIVGDDIVYLRIIDGEPKAVNVERGIFGIIKDVNSQDDPILFKSLTRSGEIIFSNILIGEDKVPFWSGKSKEVPSKGVNFFGPWFPGKTDHQGQEIPPSHKNARYTIRLSNLENIDANLENPLGVKVEGFIYGGRDSDTSVPVEEAFNWQHGIITKAASLESETTAATLGQEGVRVFNPMSNIDFLSIPLGKYLKMNLEFSRKLAKPPLVFSVNYFLKDKENKFLNSIQDKRIWLRWMKLRVDKSAKALLTPTGLIPRYEDLKTLFKNVLNKEYLYEDYLRQFTLRIPENLSKIERIENIYKDLKDIPLCLFEELKAQRQRLGDFQRLYGDYVSPEKFSKETDA